MPKLREFIWFEKHRPTQLSQLSLNKEYRKAFNSFIEAGQIPHLLLEGPQGSGKTTIAYILMHQIPCVTLILNASGEDRGIDTIKGKVKQFAGTKVAQDKIKIMLLDEADQLTSEAQKALRNTMETYSKNCRFILTCNYVDKVIAPIQSRCMRFTFDQFPKRKIVSLCENILEQEGVTGHTKEDISDLVDKFYPDIRTVVQNLQMASLGGGTFNPKAIGQLQTDPLKIAESISSGTFLTLRTQIAGIVDFMFLYRYLLDYYVPLQDDPAAQFLMIKAIGDAVRVENVVPDREINFVTCAAELCDAMEVPINCKL
jgi:DNA polymerase III delta prime subunit